MKKVKTEEIAAQLSEGYEPQGNLVLGIFCRDCDAHFEVNPSSVAMAMITGASVWDYVKYVQDSRCEKCSKESQ